MAKFKMSVSKIDKSKVISRQIRQSLTDAIVDVTLDLKRVASQSAPHDSGFLEKNAQHEIYSSGSYVEGSVGFSAVERGFDYAQWTHDKDYELGEKSAKKKGGKSRFGSGTVPVGKGYLENALENNKQGYMRHIEEKYREAINK